MLDVTARQGLVVWVYSLKQIKALRHFGTVLYVSKRMKYVYLYLDEDKMADTIAQVEKLRFVKSVTVSPQAALRTEYGGHASFAAVEDDEDDDAPKGGSHARH
ncbi:YlbG family protein [Lacticaseibacillus kribbianus]|uniref:YlbG family protein n=1 Tax=Lacticaseibacillus kribbianus TaxID=2926292 RepID=UPI001CD61FB2|nr:YlbG family protein [Lacticaseibacillus kribbianus]